MATTPSEKRKINEATSKTIKQAFDMALNLKKNTVGVTTYKGYYSRVNSLQDFIIKKYPDVVAVHQLSKTILVEQLI